MEPINNLTLHEAIVLALLERKQATGMAAMTNHELQSVIASRDLFRQQNGDYPDEAQVFLRARQCAEWFTTSGDARHCEVSLNPMKCGGA